MKKALIYLGLVFGIVFVLFVVLKIGFSIESLNSRLFTLEQLYIKLDKKLIVKAQKISLNTPNDENVSLSSAELLDIVQKVEFAYNFFEEIDIQNFHFKNQNARILFKNDEFFVDNDKIFLRLDLKKEDKTILANIKNALLKDYNASLEGMIEINARKDSYAISGKAQSSSATLDMNASFANESLKFELQNVQISETKNLYENLKHLVTDKGLNAKLEEWLAQKIKANYALDFVRGEVELKKDNITFKSLDGAGVAKDVKVYLAKNAAPLQTSAVDIKLTGGELELKSKDLSFEKANLSASGVKFYKLLEPKKGGVLLEIKTPNLMLTQSLAEILKAYKVNLGFLQTAGSFSANLVFKMPFDKDDPNTYEGVLEPKNALLNLAGLNAQSGKLRLKDKKLEFDNVSLKNDELSTLLSGELDLIKKNGSLNAQNFKVNIKDILSLEEAALALSVDYQNDFLIDIKKYQLLLNLSQGFSVQSARLDLFVPYSALLQKLRLKSAAQFSYSSKDLKDFNLSVQNAYFESDFIKSDGTPYQNDDFILTQFKENLSLKTKSKLIDIAKNNKAVSVNVKDLSYILKDFNSSSELDTQDLKVQVNAINSGIYFKDMNKSLKFDEASASLQGKSVQAKATRGGAKFELLKAPNALSLNIYNVKDKIINEFFAKEAVVNGDFSLSLNGKSADDLSGQIIIENTFFKDLKFHNQFISFIDTIPSLLMFKSPTFNEKGLNVKQGAVIFDKKNKIINVKALTLHGDSVDILGLGNVNLNNDSLNLELELRTLKSATDIIANIPILNQVILGKERVISTQIQVDGKISEPKFHTNIAKETLKLPFNLIRNIIDLPANLFN